MVQFCERVPDGLVACKPWMGVISAKSASHCKRKAISIYNNAYPDVANGRKGRFLTVQASSNDPSTTDEELVNELYNKIEEAKRKSVMLFGDDASDDGPVIFDLTDE